VPNAIPRIAVALTFLCLAGPARAVEEGFSIYPKGYMGFMSGVLPPEPGFYMTNSYYFFQGSAGREVRNGNIEANANIELNADFFNATFVTDWHVLGATFAYGGLVDYAWLNLDASVQTALGGVKITADRHTIGDTFIQPAILGWHDGLLNWTLAMNVYVPTGPYQFRQLNIGRNVWGFLPQFSLTYFNPATGLDMSGSLIYVTMSNNTTTNYQSGDILHLDWALGKHFGSWEFGVTGNVVAQLGADSGSGARLGPFKANSLGIGPGLNYTTALGSTPTSFAVRWERDFNAHNTFKGDVVLGSATFVF